MRTVRAMIAVAGGCSLIMGACANGRDDTNARETPVTASATTLPPVTTTTRVTTTTTGSPSTDTGAPSTDTAAPGSPVPEGSTSTSGPDVGDASLPIELSGAGIGVAAFGADAETVVAGVSAALGAPTLDSGYVDPVTFGACPGTQARIVSWGVLQLLFSDEAPEGTAPPHLVGFEYGTLDGINAEPVGLVTDAGVGPGSTVADLRNAYPGVILNEGEEGLLEPTFFVNEALRGFLTGTTDADTVTVIVGGTFCGV